MAPPPPTVEMILVLGLLARPRPAAGDDDARASALPFMSKTARLGSLADAIHDCRDKANALDWAAWNRNYF